MSITIAPQIVTKHCDTYTGIERLREVTPSPRVIQPVDMEAGSKSSSI